MRALRRRRDLRQADVARLAGCSHPTVSRLERGHLGEVTLDRLRGVATALDARVVVDVHWRGGALPRLLDERHATMQSTLAGRLAALPGWQFALEASFSVYGERGSVDLFGWHAQRAALVVVELKSEIADLQDLLATLDRKRRLAPTIARDGGWHGRVVGTWVVVEESHANRRRVADLKNLLRYAFPADGRAMKRWLADPREPIAALSFLTVDHRVNGRRAPAPRSRIRRATASPQRRDPCSGPAELEPDATVGR